MQFNITYDASVDQAPAGFRDAIDYVTKLYGTIFTNNVTVAINIGFGEVAGQKFGDAGKSSISVNDDYNFYSVRNALNAENLGSSLPATDPTGGQKLLVSYAEAKALGLRTPENASDGSVGFSSSMSFDYRTTGQISAGKIDFVAVVEHEFSEVMGRTYSGPSALNSVLNLYRYSSPGELALGSTSSTIRPYFSTDGGGTPLQYFNNPGNSGGSDYGDWEVRSGSSPFIATVQGLEGQNLRMSATDIAVMKALGWQTNTIGTGFNVTGNGETDLLNSVNGNLSVVQINASGEVAGTVAQGTSAFSVNAGVTGATLNLNSGNVVLGNGSSASVNGLSNTVNIGSGIAAAAIGNGLKVIVGSNSGVTVSGSGNTVDAGDGCGIGLVGDHNTLNAKTYSTAVDYGNWNTVTVLGNSHLTVFGDHSHDNVYGPGSTVALAGNNSETTVGDNSVVLISGIGNLVRAGNNDTIAISGIFNHVFSGASTLALDVGNSNTIAAGAFSAITNIGSNGTDSAGIGSTFLVGGSSNVFLVNPSSAYVMGSAGIDTLKGTIANFAGDLINGLARGMHIDVTDLIPSGVSASFTGSASAGVLTLASASQYFAVSTYGAINPRLLHVSNDGNNGTLLTYGT